MEEIIKNKLGMEHSCPIYVYKNGMYL